MAHNTHNFRDTKCTAPTKWTWSILHYNLGFWWIYETKGTDHYAYSLEDTGSLPMKMTSASGEALEYWAISVTTSSLLHEAYDWRVTYNTCNILASDSTYSIKSISLARYDNIFRRTTWSFANVWSAHWAFKNSLFASISWVSSLHAYNENIIIFWRTSNETEKFQVRSCITQTSSSSSTGALLSRQNMEKMLQVLQKLTVTDKLLRFSNRNGSFSRTSTSVGWNNTNNA